MFNIKYILYQKKKYIYVLIQTTYFKFLKMRKFEHHKKIQLYIPDCIGQGEKNQTTCDAWR